MVRCIEGMGFLSLLLSGSCPLAIMHCGSRFPPQTDEGPADPPHCLWASIRLLRQFRSDSTQFACGGAPLAKSLSCIIQTEALNTSAGSLGDIYDNAVAENLNGL